LFTDGDSRTPIPQYQALPVEDLLPDEVSHVQTAGRPGTKGSQNAW